MLKFSTNLLVFNCYKFDYGEKFHNIKHLMYVHSWTLAQERRKNTEQLKTIHNLRIFLRNYAKQMFEF